MVAPYHIHGQSVRVSIRDDSRSILSNRGVINTTIHSKRRGMTTNTPTVPLGMSLITLRLCYDLGHAHNPQRFATNVLNSGVIVEVPESSQFFTNHYGTTMNHSGVSTVLLRILPMQLDLINQGIS